LLTLRRDNWLEADVRLILIDAEEVFRTGLRLVLERECGAQIVAEYANPAAAIDAIAQTPVDGAIVDTGPDGSEGPTLIASLIERSPRLRALVLTTHSGRRRTVEALRAGAAGYLLKTDPVATLVTAMRVVGRGGRYLSPALGGPELPASKGAELGPLMGVTPRERHVLRLIISGLSTLRIADALHISPKTVETHRTHLNRKLRCRCSADLLRFAATNGLLDWIEAPAAEGAGERPSWPPEDTALATDARRAEAVLCGDDPTSIRPREITTAMG
jgi:DNA-binding NarL/FixJ family response regulator